MSINHTLHHILQEAWEFVASVDTNNTLMVDGLNFEDDECVYINKSQRELYCIELAGSSNIQEVFENRKVDQLFADYKNKDNGFFIGCCLKRTTYQKNLIFANNKKLLSEISRYLSGRFLKFDEIINTLYDLMLDNKYTIKNKLLHKDIVLSDTLKYETISTSFNKYIKESVYRNFEDIKIYQGVVITKRDEKDIHPDGKVDLVKLFKHQWNGAIYTYVDLRQRSVQSYLVKKQRKCYLDGGRDDWVRLEEDMFQGRETLCIVNIVAMLKDDTEIGDVASCLGVNFIKKDLFKRKIIKYLPIMRRDSYYDIPIDKEFLYGYISSVHKENHNEKRPDIYGFDLMGGYWNYRFDAPTPRNVLKNASILVLGLTGAGKTTLVNGMLAQILGLNIKTGDLKYLDENYIRDFDIKKSGRSLKEIVSKKYKVRSLKADLNNFVYNPLNIEVIYRTQDRVVLDQNQLSMNISLLSLALEAKSANTRDNGLNSAEQLKLADLIQEVYNSNSYGNGTLYELIELGRRETYNELIALGYNGGDKFSSIKEPEYDYLIKPTLQNVIKILSTKRKSEDNEVKRKLLESLDDKLDIIEQMKIFSGYDAISLDASLKYLYIDFDDVKEIPEYVPIFLAIFNKMYSVDKKNQDKLREMGLERPTIYYKFEECKNIFAQPSFQAYLDKFNNEARSFGIRILFSTQLIAHVPSYIYSQIQNLLLLFPEKAKKAQLIAEIVEACKPPQDVIDMLSRTEAFGCAIYNEHGCTIAKLPLTAEEIKCFGQTM